jgi:hypothetical protein
LDVSVGTGEKIERPQSPSLLRTFVVPSLFPLAGFVLLWGIMKRIAWDRDWIHCIKNNLARRCGLVETIAAPY